MNHYRGSVVSIGSGTFGERYINLTELVYDSFEGSYADGWDIIKINDLNHLDNFIKKFDVSIVDIDILINNFKRLYYV